MAQRSQVPSRASFVSHFTFCRVPAATLFFTLCLTGALLGSVSVDAYGAEDLQSSLPTTTDSDIEDESFEDDDDGSRALPEVFKALNPEDVVEITLEEEQALLGNWGDTEAEEGD